MWDRKELKARGMAAFRANYWKCVLTAFINILIIGGGGISAGRIGYHSSGSGNGEVTNFLNKMSPEAMFALVAAIIGIAAVAGIVIFIVKELLLNPLRVGCSRFFWKNSDSPASLDELIFGYKENFWNMVKTILLQDIFIVLWSLLFIIPGIVKSYSYRMVPYILAEDPFIGSTEAISLSMQMMKGHKWRAFVLDLSFLGWDILGAITLGIVGVFFAQPYHQAANAELYKAVKEQFAC